MSKEQVQNQERPVVAFWNKHKKGIFIATGVVGTIGVAVLTVLGIKLYWNASAFERWFKKATLDELREARNNIHAEYMSHTQNDKYRESLWRLLPQFDKRIATLEWAGKTPGGPAYHREHGYGLYKPD